MQIRNSGLGCGCSSGTNEQGMGEIPVYQLQPQPYYRVVKPSYPRTATLTTGRQSLAPMSPSQVWMQFFREGMAFGVAWAASLEQGRTVSAQWHRDLERAAQNTAIPTSPTGAVASNRDAFVAGFDFGIRIVMERRIEITAPNGRRYSLDFLRTQGRVAANNLFGQTRPAILPAIAGPTGMAPTAPGTVTQMSTYDQFMGIARSAIAANLASALSGSVRRIDLSTPQDVVLAQGDMSALVGVGTPFRGPSISSIPTSNVFTRSAIYNGVYSTRDPAAVWALFLMGNMGSLLAAPRTLDRGTYDVVKAWADFQRLPATWGAGTPAGPYIRAILNTTWVPQSNAGRTYYSSVGSR